MKPADYTSRVLRDTLELPQPDEHESTDGSDTESLPEIPIDAKEAVVKRLLDAFTLDKPLEPYRWSVASRAIELTYLFDSPGARERLVWSVIDHWDDHCSAWNVFKAFARADQYTAAKIALGRVSESFKVNANSFKLEDATAIPVPYLLGLMREFEKHPSGTWADIARDFKPAK